MKTAVQISEQIMNVVDSISENDSERIVDDILNADNVFLAGAGRSGLVARAFAMRLMHLGKNVFVVGETTTPSIKKDDLIIFISGSGKTRSLISIAEVVKNMGAKIAIITTDNNSTLAKLANTVIIVPTGSKNESTPDYGIRQITGAHRPLTPMGTLFELSAHVFCDALISEIMRIKGISEQEMKEKHTQLE